MRRCNSRSYAKRLLVIVGIWLFLMSTGCAGVALDPTQVGTIKRVGTVSLIGDVLNASYVGLTAFSNASSATSVESWQIDRHVADAVSQELRENSPLVVVGVDYDRQALKRKYEEARKGIFREFDASSIAEDLKRLAERHNLDAIVLVVSASNEDPIMHATHISGYGIFQRNVIFSTKTAFYVYAKGGLIETKSMETLRSFGLFSFNREVDNSYGAADFAALPAEKQQQVEAWLKSALREKIQVGLRRIGLSNGAYDPPVVTDPDFMGTVSDR